MGTYFVLNIKYLLKRKKKCNYRRVFKKIIVVFKLSSIPVINWVE